MAVANLGTLKANCVAELGLDLTADATQMTTRANEAVLDILLRTGCYTVVSTMTETASQGDYRLDSGIIRVKGWQWSGSSSYSEPERVPIDELLTLRASNISGGSYPASYYACEGDLLLVYPTPSGADTITLYYTPRPTAMSSDSHDPSSATYGGIPPEFHPAVEQYMLWKLASADDDQTSGQGERYRGYYEGQDGDGGWVRAIRKYVNRKGDRPSRARVGFSGQRRGVYHDNSIYP